MLRDHERSRRELELHWQVANHPNVVCIGDMFENTFDEIRCLLVVVEFMAGGDLLTMQVLPSFPLMNMIYLCKL